LISIYLVTPTSWTNIFGMAADAAGNLYVLAGSSASEITFASVVKIAPDLTVTTVSQMPVLGRYWVHVVNHHN
jgi:hypothetical protein